VLLISTITDGNQLSELLFATREAGLQALVECYNREDVERLKWNEIEVFGVNNRDLHTFEVDVHKGIHLLKEAPEDIITVSESGISSADDLLTLLEHNIDAALIGEYFMRQDDPGLALRNLVMAFKNRMKTETE
ncbi:MAG: indole-3-glycerol-phosphate synthase, partial [Balneolaceae bacterium]